MIQQQNSIRYSVAYNNYVQANGLPKTKEDWDTIDKYAEELYKRTLKHQDLVNKLENPNNGLSHVETQKVANGILTKTNRPEINPEDIPF